MIEKIEFLKKYACLDKGFMWNQIPKLAVIGGINGAGKTKLLERFKQACDDQHRFNVRRDEVSLFPDIDFHGKVQYVPINHAFDDLSNDPPGTSQHVEKRNEAFVNYATQAKDLRTNPDYNKAIEKIEKKYEKTIDALSNEQIIAALSPELSQYLENGFNNKFIAEVFKAYQVKIDNIKISYFRRPAPEDDEIYEQIGCPPPWKVINDLFEKHAFAYRITEPTHSVAYTPEFREKEGGGKDTVRFGSLSSGEKIIVSLILWAYNEQLGNKIKIFLLDEFDAHLNPSMSKMFIEVVKEKLVREFGIQIIMTTHSPSTVAYVDDEDLFWMERGKGIRRAQKREVIPILSDGVMTYQEAGSLLACVVNSEKPAIMFTEGKTDVNHIKIAKEKLGVSAFFDVFPCGDTSCGADKLRQFLVACPAELFKGKKVIGLFDCDEQGLKQKKYFNMVTNDLYISKTNSDVYALFLPVPREEFAKYENCPIEFLYSKEILEKHGVLSVKRQIAKINSYHQQEPLNSADYNARQDLWFYEVNDSKKVSFAESISSLDPSEFKNFHLIFNLVESICKKSS